MLARVWPFSPRWQDPLGADAQGSAFKSRTGIRIREVGSGDTALIFIHGLGASLRYWGTAYDSLAARRRLIFVDLAGFGGSDKPAAPYDLEFHAKVIAETLDELGIGTFGLVGHSTGAAVVMRIAVSSNMAARVVTFGAPIFPSDDVARDHLGRLGMFERAMAEGSPMVSRMCRFMCDHRELSRRLAPLLVPRLPAAVASDGVDHTWASFSGTFNSLLRDFDARNWAGGLGSRLTLVYGSEDETTPARLAARTLEPLPVDINVVRGNHHLPLYEPTACMRFIDAMA